LGTTEELFKKRCERRMKNESSCTTLTVDQTPDEVFAAVTNVRGWWSENIEGGADKLEDVFTYRYEDHHYSKAEVTELVPGKRLAWTVLDNTFDFIEDQSEWTGTEVIIDISRDGSKTIVKFTHEGLVPQFECFDVCANSWDSYINGSLRNLITTGKGNPNPKE
jgi:regulatory protein YycH of two-component signal transduction system YycFG